MMSPLRFCRAVVLGFACMGTMMGCAATQPSKFYLLTPLPNSETAEQGLAVKDGVAIGIGPIDLPEYLNRPQIVTRAGRNELGLAEFNKWGEPLQDNISRVLAENLSILLSTDRTALFPWNSSTAIDYQIRVEMIRFDSEPGGNIFLSARWSLYGENGREVLLVKKSQITNRADGQDYDALVAAMSGNLADLSREIATAIKARMPKQPDR